MNKIKNNDWVVILIPPYDECIGKVTTIKDDGVDIIYSVEIPFNDGSSSQEEFLQSEIMSMTVH